MPFDIRRRREQMEMDPRFQRATYARQMITPRQLATPDVSDIVRGYAGRQAEVEEYGAGRGAKIGMREKEAATEVGLREKGLAFGEKKLAFAEKTRTAQIAASERDLAYQRDVQSAMKTQNRTATYLAIADVGLNVLGGYADIKESKRQEAFMAEQQDYFKNMSVEQQTYFREMSTMLESLITRRILTSRGGY